MTSFQLSLLYIFVMMFYLMFTFQYISKKVPIIKANQKTKLGVQFVKVILIPLIAGLFIITSIFLYIGDQAIEAKSKPLDTAYTRFYALSESHKTLGTVYRECSSAILKPTQASCVREMENIAKYEGISEEFLIVYNDLKTHIFPVEESARQ